MKTNTIKVALELAGDPRFAFVSTGDLAGDSAVWAMANLIGHWRDAIESGRWKPTSAELARDINDTIERLRDFKDRIEDLSLILPGPLPPWGSP